MTDATLRQALAYAARGWPVFPCQPGQKIPATTHGYRDATTDPEQITDWFARHPTEPGHRHRRPRPRRPGRRPARPGRQRLRRLRASSATPGCSTAPPPTSAPPAAACTPTSPAPHQRNGHLPAHHLDFRSAGGYVLAPPSQVGGQPLPAHQAATAAAAAWTGPPSPGSCNPSASPPAPPRQPRPPGQDLDHLARWVAAQPEGNRNAGLFWAANRALETDPPPTSARWPPPPARPAWPTPRSPAPSTPPAAPASPTASPTTKPRPADMSTTPPPPPAPRTRRAARSHRGRPRRARLAAAGPRHRGRTAMPTPARRVDAGGTRLRLRALHVMGHGSARIARALGVRETTIQELVRGDARTVSPQLRDADHRPVRRLVGQTRPRTHPRRTRRRHRRPQRAIAGNWCAAAALDDDQLDTPGYRPQLRLETRHRHRRRPRHPPRPPATTQRRGA